MILSPRGKASYRLIVIAQKRLPAVSESPERKTWALVEHVTHLAYVRGLPMETGDVQRAFNLVDEASYVVAVKNPKAAPTPRVALDPVRKAEFPANLLKRFRGRRFINLDSPDFLDHEGAEIVVVGASQHVFDELGLELDPEHETGATAAIFTDLRLEKSVHPLRPLFEGRWE